MERLQEDLYPIREEDKSAQRTDLLEKKWCEEKELARNRGREPKLWRAIYKYFTICELWYFVSSGAAYLLGENLVWYATINLLHQRMISNANQSHITYYVYIYAIAIGGIIRLLGQNHLHLHGAVLGVRARAAMLSILYKKVML